MSIRQSTRLQGAKPEYGLLESQPRQTKVVRRAEPEFTRQRIKVPRSLPEMGAKVASAAPVEEPITLDKDEILRILSSEMPMEKAAIIEKFLKKSNIKNQQVPAIYSSYFFRKDIIKEFQSNLLKKIPDDKLPGFPLSTYNLYNKDDLLNNTFYRPDRSGVRYTEKNTNYSIQSNDNMKIIMEYLSKNVCSSIGPHYARTAVEKVLDLVKNEDQFDILVASPRIIEDLTLPIERRIEHIVAFIIVEMGECKKYPEAYSINLICTDLKNAISGTGSILMGAFLYTILSHPENTNSLNPITFPDGNSLLKVTSKRMPDGSVIEKALFTTTEPLIEVQQVAVLELASAYTNPGGLCMYEKYGFQYDQTMFSNKSARPPIKCFDDRNNLPMLIDFSSKPGYAGLSQDEKKDKVLNIAAGLDRGFPKSAICSVRDPQKQRLLGLLKTIKLYVDNEPGATVDDFLNSSIAGPMLRQLKQIHAPPITGSRRSAPQTKQRQGTIEEFITYIENPQTTPDPDMEAKVATLISLLPKEKKKGGNITKKIYRHRLKK